MCLFRCPRFLVWFFLNVFFCFDILLNRGWITNNGHQRNPVNVSLVSPSSSTFIQLSSSSETENELSDKIRLLCWVPSVFGSSISHGEKIIRETWGKRCDRLLFVFITNINNGSAERMSEIGNDGVIRLFVRTTSDVLQYLYDHHLNDSDWFLKADEKTFVVVEQLKTMLSIQETTTPCYLAANDKQNSVVIGDTYVLSRESIRRLVHHFRHQPDFDRSRNEADCKQWGNFGNFSKRNIALPKSVTRKCLNRLGIVSYNTQDERGCERFLSSRLVTELAYDSTNSGARCISGTAVIFSRIPYNQFHVYEHLLYRLSLN